MKREVFVFMLAIQVLTDNITEDEAEVLLERFDKNLGYPLPKTVKEAMELLK